MNWKIRFRELTGWKPKNKQRTVKNDEEQWRISTKSLTEMSRKHYESTSAWIFFTETIFLTNFERFLHTRRAEPICSALFPLFIGEKREVVAAQLAQASRVAFTRRHRLLLEHSRRPKWAWLLFAPPFSLSTPPWCFFIDFFPKRCGTLQIIQWHMFFLPKCCESLRITQRCLFRGFQREQTRFKDRPQVLPGKIRVWQRGSKVWGRRGRI